MVRTGVSGRRSIQESIGVPLDSGTVYELLVVAPGTWTVTARPEGDQDVFLRIPDIGCDQDIGLGGDSESCTLSAEGVVVIQVEAGPFSDNDAYGAMRLEVK